MIKKYVAVWTGFWLMSGAWVVYVVHKLDQEGFVLGTSERVEFARPVFDVVYRILGV